MVCHHQNPIKKTIGLTISPFFMMTNLGYLGEKKSFPQTNHGSIKQFLIGSNVKHENLNREQWIMKISYHIYMATSHVHENIC